jgi:hypothetical protein
VPHRPKLDPDEAPAPVRGPLQGLQDVSAYLDDHPVNTGAFVRGLTVGALVGAAIAGLSIWRRLRRPDEPNAGAGGGA